MVVETGRDDAAVVEARVLLEPVRRATEPAFTAGRPSDVRPVRDRPLVEDRERLGLLPLRRVPDGERAGTGLAAWRGVRLERAR